MKRLRTYAPLRRQGLKRQRQAPDFRAVYRQVDQRSEGRCEAPGTLASTLPFPIVSDQRGYRALWRCGSRATDHHHCLKPRLSHHDADLIVHLCRHHHDRCEFPYKRGRLTVVPLGQGRFQFDIRFQKVTA